MGRGDCWLHILGIRDRCDSEVRSNGATVKREIREVIAINGQTLVRCTMPDERWYSRIVSADGTEENRRWDFVPSVTWVAEHYPKGTEFYKWLASKGWSEAEAIKSMAGDKGSKVHQAVGALVAGGTVEMEDAFENPRTNEPEPLTAEQYFCLMTFCEWCQEEQPEFIANELTVSNEKYRYAGTLDLMCRLKSTGYKILHIIDVKTSQYIWPSFELQVSAYKHADISIPKNTRLGILQVGYKKNKLKKWKYTPVADQFPLFLAARKIWEKECSNMKPFQRDYPLSLSLNGLLKVSAESKMPRSGTLMTSEGLKQDMFPGVASGRNEGVEAQA